MTRSRSRATVNVAQKLLIFGAGDFAQVARVYLQESDYQVVAFTVDAAFIQEPALSGIEVAPFEEVESRFPPGSHVMFVAVGYGNLNRNRAEICQRCKEKGYKLITYVSPRASLTGDVQVGANCFIFENNVIQPFVRIGDNVVMWSGNHIGHHSAIGDNCFIASHAVISGRVTIGNNCFIGVNATIRDGVHVAPETVVGAGALILHDTPPRAVYRGAESEPSSVTSDRLRRI